MRLAVLLLLPLVLLGVQPQEDAIFPQKSPHASVSQVIGTTEVTIEYDRPRVMGRPIWGALVPYGKVWRTGANSATTIRFSDSVTVGGEKLPAGKYSVFTIPDRNQWTIIFNRQVKAWGTYDYKPQDDVVRIYRRPKNDGRWNESLTFAITPASTASAYVTLAWEKVEVSFLVEVDLDTLVTARMKRYLAQAGKGNWEAYAEAANYLQEMSKDLDLALDYVNRSIRIQENARNCYVKAHILRQKGEKAKAMALLEKAEALARTAHDPPKVTGPIEETLLRWRAEGR